MKRSLIIVTALLLSINLNAKAVCDLSNVPNIDGLHIGMTAKDFLSMHPTAVDEPMPGDKSPRQSRLDFPLRNGELLGHLKGTGGIGHIATLNGVVYSYAISFLDAGADYETFLDDFKNMLIERYRLPRDGWRPARENSVKLQCGDIRIEVFQDHGAAHTAIGPTLFVRDMRLAKIADRLN